MDRITYISSYSEELTSEDIEEIGRVSVANNKRDNLTGVLICLRGNFYQIIEGDSKLLSDCFNRIQQDPRHSNIFILNIEKNIEERQYGQWNMKTILLENNTNDLILPIQNLLDSLTGTHQILEKYTPVEVLDGIQQGLNPVYWKFKRDELVVLFSDLVSFTTITEKINLSEMKILLDTFFELASNAIEKSNGRITKLTGDGFMAYYPLEAATSALRASIEIIKGLKKQREISDSAFLSLAYCGIGLSAGIVVRGNIGSTIKKDYTILGDVVNSASRLESLTREIGYSILFDQRFMKYYEASSDLRILKLGEHTLKGKSKRLKVYTVEDPDILFDRTPEEIANEIMAIQV